MKKHLKRYTALQLIAIFLLPVFVAAVPALESEDMSGEHACCQSAPDEKAPAPKSCSAMHARANSECDCPDMQQQPVPVAHSGPATVQVFEKFSFVTFLAQNTYVCTAGLHFEKSPISKLLPQPNNLILLKQSFLI